MILNTKKGITIEMGVKRTINMNDSLPYPTCLQNKDWVPSVMTTNNLKYMEIVLCKTVLNCAILAE